MRVETPSSPWVTVGHDLFCIFILILPSLFSVVAVVVVTVSLTFEENPPISFQLLDDRG